MNPRDWIVLVVAAAAVGAAVWLLSRWWFGRQLQQARHQMDKVDRAGKLSAEQNVQARKQIETLQKELAATQKTLNDARRSGAVVQRSGSTAQERAAAAEAALAAVAPPPSAAEGAPANGFADTQPMSDSRFR